MTYDCSVKREQRAAQKCLSAVNQHLTKRGFKATIQRHACSCFASNYF